MSIIGNPLLLGGGKSDVYAFIKVTYPSGGICTATNGVTTLKARDTSGSWLFQIPNRGTFPQTWAIVIWDASHTIEIGDVVTITSEGQSEILNFEMGSSLPVEYQKVEYIQSSGSQYILTDIPGNSSDIMIADMQLSAFAAQDRLFGVNKPSPAFLYHAYVNGSGQFSCMHSTSGTGPSTSLTANTNRHTFKADPSVGKFYVDSSSMNIGTLSGTTTACYAVFNASDTWPEGGRAKAKCWSFEIKRSGTTICYLIPCYRRVDSVAGMFDVINWKFYPNAGTGTFIVGGDV